MLLLLPVVGLGADVRVELGMAYPEGTNSLAKSGGTDITSDIGWLYQRSHKWSFWDLRDYGAVVLLVETGGKITHLSYWSTEDFKDPDRRTKAEQSIRRFQLDTIRKKLRFEKAPGQEPRPNQRLQATAAAPFGFGSPGDSQVPGFFVAQSPAAVPEPHRSE